MFVIRERLYAHPVLQCTVQKTWKNVSYHIYAGYSQLYVWNKPMFFGKYSVVDIAWLQFMLRAMLFQMLQVLYFFH
jgi:hypothetical protein